MTCPICHRSDGKLILHALTRKVQGVECSRAVWNPTPDCDAITGFVYEIHATCMPALWHKAGEHATPVDNCPLCVDLIARKEIESLSIAARGLILNRLRNTLTVVQCRAQLGRECLDEGSPGAAKIELDVAYEHAVKLGNEITEFFEPK